VCRAPRFAGGAGAAGTATAGGGLSGTAVPAPRPVAPPRRAAGPWPRRPYGRACAGDPDTGPGGRKETSCR